MLLMSMIPIIISGVTSEKKEPMGSRLGTDIGFMKDGRVFAASHSFTVEHVTPETQVCGSIGVVRDGGLISSDATQNHLSVGLSAGKLDQRKRR